MDLEVGLGFRNDLSTVDREAERLRLTRYIVLKLIANGLPHPVLPDLSDAARDAELLLAAYHQRLVKADEAPCPIDARIESFLNSHFAELQLAQPLRLPRRAIILNRHGLAREMSLPMDGDHNENGLLSSYRVRNGVLHNPTSDRRTTSGTFHVTMGGLPVPRDKKAVPKAAFAALLNHAVSPPPDVLELPFTANLENQARSFVSLLIRPLVCPEVPGVCPEKRMEVRFFAPGSLVSNLDFVESIFGNGGDPYLPENDAGLDVEHWSGHTGCVILAPHLTKITKKAAGLPRYEEATAREREDGMCWKSEDELYNEGQAFKLTCRTDDGVIVTLIADSYYGYCKKEVKTQISYATNLMGNVEEEHAGGTLAFASFNLGEEFTANSRRYNGRSFDDVARDYGGSLMDVDPRGFGVDKKYPKEVLYIPENARASVQGQTITWQRNGQDVSIPLLPEQTYITPAGYKLRLEKHPTAPSWRLIGTLFEGVLCHKPCTVSGGGKSEISKSVVDYVLYGPIFVADQERDLDWVQRIFDRDYQDRWKSDAHAASRDYQQRPSRKVLDPSRSLGSVIKLLTPSTDYSDEYNHWLGTIPSYVYALVFIIKRFHRGDDKTHWREKFSVDVVNGTPGHELRYLGRKLVGDYLRVGLTANNAWRTFKLRQDFAPADKVQTEDDISASVVVPRVKLSGLGTVIQPAMSYKFVENCEFRLFQRPDDAVHRGLDKQCEADLSRDDNFVVNFEPLSKERVVDICQHAVDLSQFTPPMQKLMRDVAASEKDRFVVCSAEPRKIDGKPSQNPRYLQNRPDLVNPVKTHVAHMGVRLARAIPADQPVHIPVQAVLFGRRNNPPDYKKGIRPLAVYSPLHFQELPELFMDFISSLTGKSPSTTGAGSEGALTKGPFNAVLPITDLNNALVSYLLTGLAGYSTAAGYIGPNMRVDHDVSLLIPEIWCRLSPEERDPQFLIREGLMERMDDYTHNGKLILASRLGYRVTSRFINRFVARVFDNPNKVFDEPLLRPELQDADAFADGICYVTEAHERVARQYFEDGAIDQACPPLKALLHIMAFGQFEGRTAADPSIRSLFTLESMLASDWYQRRLEKKQQRDIGLWTRHVSYLKDILRRGGTECDRLQLASRLKSAEQSLAQVSAAGYLEELRGTLGADPMVAT